MSKEQGSEVSSLKPDENGSAMCPQGEEISPKSRLVALLLCFFFGAFGFHRFYVGKHGTAILQLVTLGGLGLWALYDLVMIVVGKFRDKEGRLVFVWVEPGSV